MKDFTLEAFRLLLEAAEKNGYVFTPYREFITAGNRHQRTVVLRHDVDARPLNALAMAVAENKMNIRSTYYFRDISQTFKKGVILKIANLQHEIGYHYENMSKCRGNADKAYEDFEISLQRLREVVPIDTISAHGRPTSRFNNLSLWEKFDYKKAGIMADINRDTDYSDILYVTDTGGSWNSRFNRRDKVSSDLRCDARTTFDLINQFNNHSLPPRIVINIHPQRWTDNNYGWYTNRVFQKMRNTVKYLFFIKNQDGRHPS